jgi:Rps23 Pro-64 3,4-dihydroxylase Tpa1-like proline 4-hydroxylase
MHKGVIMQPTKFQDIMHELLASGGLFDKAEDALQQMVAAHPDDRQALWRLGHIYRSQGKFEAAVEAYRRCTALDPDDLQAVHLAAVLQSHDLPVAAPPSGLWPAPFVYMPSFLSQAQHDQALALTSDRHDKLQRAQVVKQGNVNPQIRSAWVLGDNEFESIRSWFLLHIQAVVPTILTRLQIDPFDVGRVELQMTTHRAGDFFTVHQDQDDDAGRGRLVSYVYYFHRTPKRFTGGDLLLYDTDAQENAYSAAFTRIVPQDNSIIFFPSQYWHQVTPVHYTTDDTGDGRFTLNGWVHVKKN